MLVFCSINFNKMRRMQQAQTVRSTPSLITPIFKERICQVTMAVSTIGLAALLYRSPVVTQLSL